MAQFNNGRGKKTLFRIPRLGAYPNFLEQKYTIHYHSKHKTSMLRGIFGNKFVSFQTEVVFTYKL